MGHIEYPLGFDDAEIELNFSISSYEGFKYDGINILSLAVYLRYIDKSKS